MGDAFLRVPHRLSDRALIVTLLRALTVSPDIKATSSLCVLFLILVLMTAVDAVSNNRVLLLLECGQHHETCSLWFHESFVVAGRDYKVHEPIGWQDVVIPFTQHDRRAFPYGIASTISFKFLMSPTNSLCAVLYVSLGLSQDTYNLHMEPITQILPSVLGPLRFEP